MSTSKLQWISGGIACLLIASSASVHSEERTAAPNTTTKSPDSATGVAQSADSTPQKQLYRGKVVKASDALKRRGVKASFEELKNQVVLETSNELIPILPDWRGRAFFQDERLRDREVELIGFRRPGLPYLSILSVYTFDAKGQRQYTDYWCDICSIPMYELKPCDCCQEEIRLRFQPQDLPKDIQPAKNDESTTQ